MSGALAGLALGLTLAAPAAAATHTYTLRSKEFVVGGFSTIRPKVRVPSPHIDGFVTAMRTRLVFADGSPVSIQAAMLHHVVFLNDGAGARQPPGSCPGRAGQPFFGTGEEHEQLILPAGYGYRVHRRDRWRMQTMLMSHGLTGHHVRVEYTVGVVTGRHLQRVIPYWIRANGCAGLQPSYTVDGGGSPGSSSPLTWTWKAPLTGRIVAAGGHLHGGAKDLYLSQPDCNNRRIVDTPPVFGAPDDLVYRIRPVLHEPGPISTGYFLSGTGVPVREGERLSLTGVYDGAHPRARVMSIMHLYVAPERHPPEPCVPLPTDRQEIYLRRDGRTDPPYQPVPLNLLEPDGQVHEIDEPPGPVRAYAGSTVIRIRGGRFRPERISIPAGSSVTWRFEDPFEHNVLFASGPQVKETPTLSHGRSSSQTFTVPGTYRLFCYLHPVTMPEEVIVRPG